MLTFRHHNVAADAGGPEQRTEYHHSHDPQKKPTSNAPGLWFAFRLKLFFRSKLREQSFLCPNLSCFMVCLFVCGFRLRRDARFETFTLRHCSSAETTLDESGFSPYLDTLLTERWQKLIHPKQAGEARIGRRESSGRTNPCIWERGNWSCRQQRAEARQQRLTRSAKVGIVGGMRSGEHGMT
jgi:hypothetical protein